jgi:hypothetical protein
MLLEVAEDLLEQLVGQGAIAEEDFVSSSSAKVSNGKPGSGKTPALMESGGRSAAIQTTGSPKQSWIGRQKRQRILESGQRTLATAPIWLQIFRGQASGFLDDGLASRFS